MRRALAALFLGLPVASGEQEAPLGDAHAHRPDIIFIMADDLRPAWGRTYDSTVEIPTPHLDRLASESVVFDRAYCQAPSCNPSRASLMTGLSPDTTKIYYFEAQPDPLATPSFFEALKRSGYLSFGLGKLFHTSPTTWEAKHHFSAENGAYYPGNYDQEFGENTKKARVCEPGVVGCVNGRVLAEAWDDEDHFFDNVVAKEAAAKLERLAFDRHASGATDPFILGVGFHHPHLKWHVPLGLWERHANASAAPPKHRLPPRGWPVFAKPDMNIRTVHQGGNMVIQRRFNMGVFEAIPKRKASTLCVRPKR